MKKKIAIFTMISICICSLFSCKYAPVASRNTNLTSDAPYYSVTCADTILEKNYYMDLTSKIPKIVYENEESDNLFDTINDEIFENLTNIISEAKEYAKTTYEAYIKSAHDNISKDKAKKIQTLKEKYKDILNSDDLEILNSISTMSEIPVFRFTETDELIIPELHNKNIIVAETTSQNENIEKNINNDFPRNKINITMASDSNFNRKNIIESDDGKFTRKNIMRATDSNFYKNRMSLNIATKPEIIKNKKYDIPKPISTGSEITIENFYNELFEIRHMLIPNERTLRREYIPTTIVCNFDVKCLDEQYLSLYIDISSSRTASYEQRLYYNIDLSKKKIIKLKDVLGNDFKTKCIDTINKKIENWSDDKKAFLNKDYNVGDFIDEDTAFFINNNHFPVVVFDKYTITIGSFGYPEFVI